MEKTKKLHENFTEIIGKSSNCGVLTSFDAKKIKQKRLEANFKSFLWRRVRDLNPRTAHHRYTISSRAPSTTQPTLHMVAEEGFEPSQTESESVVLPLHNSAIWLPKKDSNPHKQSQSLSCYPYTIRQCFLFCRFLRTNEYYYTHVGGECQEKI